MNRFVVKSQYATITIPEVELEIPPITQKGSIKSIEGYIMTTIEGLQSKQVERLIAQPEAAEKIQKFIDKLQLYLDGKNFPFTFILDDPSGNSFVQNPYTPAKDIYMVTKDYMRTKQQAEDMGYKTDGIDFEKLDKKAESDDRYKKGKLATKKQEYTEEEVEKMMEKVSNHIVSEETAERAAAQYSAHNMDFSLPVDQQSESQVGKHEPIYLPSECFACSRPGFMKMCISYIPHFKEIIIMAFQCDHCGYRQAEVKQGGGVSAKAKKLTLQVKNEEDLNRDLYKSDTAQIFIPEI